MKSNSLGDSALDYTSQIKKLVSDIAGKMYEQSRANSLLPSLSDSSSTHTTSGFISPLSF